MRIIKKTHNKSTIAAMIGTALEHYDASLYGFMAPLLVSIFLPTFDPLNALIISFILTPISIIVRPLGALAIGYIGDKYGRKFGLIVSMSGMAAVTGSIGLLPTYSSIGFAAPILFIVMRSLQGFFMAGEYNGAAIFVLEHHENNNKGFMSGLYCMYTVVGMLAATLVVTIISYLPQEYWRIPYLIGAMGGIVGLYMRRYIHETPVFLKCKYVEDISLKTILRKYRLLLISIGVSALFSAIYVLPTLLMNSLLPIVTGFKLSTIMAINTVATVLYMITVPMFGKLADRISINKSMSIAAAVILVLSYPLINLIYYKNLFYIIAMKMSFALMIAWFCAPFHAWIQSLFHTKERYTAISFSYSIGAQLGGFMVPVSLYMWKKTESLSAIYLILIFWAVISIVALYFERGLEKHE